MAARQKTKRFWTYVYWNFSSSFDVVNHGVDSWNLFYKHPVYKYHLRLEKFHFPRELIWMRLTHIFFFKLPKKLDWINLSFLDL